MKVALVGVGGMGSVHYGILKEMPDVELVAPVDVVPEKIQAKAAETGARAYLFMEEMLKAEEVDVVDICTPSYLHPELAIQAMKQGKHVLTEKPATLCAEDISRMYSCAREHGVKLMVAHVIRFWAEYEWLKETVDSGRYGKLKDLSMWRIGQRPHGQWENWMMDEERSGLVPFDLHIHDVDFMVHMLGVPEQMDAYEVRDGEDTNMVQSFFIYPNEGIHVDIRAAWYCGRVPFSMGYRALLERPMLSITEIL